MASYTLLITVIIGALHGFVVSDKIYALAGDNVTLPCNGSDVIYPTWRGPNGTGYDVLYTYPTESRFREVLIEEKRDRLMWDKHDNRSLVIENLSRSDEGTYMCTIRPSVEKSIELSVLVLPKPVISFERKIGVEHGTIGKTYIDVEGQTIIQWTEYEELLIECRAPNGHPQPSLTWKVNTGPTLSREAKGVVVLLSLVPTTSDHRKRYTCQSSFGDPFPANKSTTVELYVNLRPTTPIVTSYIAVEGEPNNATRCLATGFRPRDIQVMWRLNGVNHVTGGRITTIENPDEPETFNMTAVFSWIPDRADDGLVLECIVYHESLFETITGTTTLIVKYKARITNFVKFDNNGKQTLRCTAESNPPPAGMAIQRQGQRHGYNQGHVLINTTNGKELEFTLHPSDCLTSGVYSCETFNKYNELEPDVEYLNISASCPPKRFDKIVVESNKEDPIMLNVTLMAYPIPETDEVTWYRRDRGLWVRQDGGFVEHLTENEFICGLDVYANDLGSGYYRVAVGNGMASTYTQMFYVEFTNDTVKARRNKGEETTRPTLFMPYEALFGTPLIACIILPTSGCAIGIIVTLLCVCLRKKCSVARPGDGGKTENTDCCPRKPPTNKRIQILEKHRSERRKTPAMIPIQISGNHPSDIDMTLGPNAGGITNPVVVSGSNSSTEYSVLKLRESLQYQNATEVRRDATDEHVYGIVA